MYIFRCNDRSKSRSYWHLGDAKGERTDISSQEYRGELELSAFLNLNLCLRRDALAEISVVEGIACETIRIGNKANCRRQVWRIHIWKFDRSPAARIYMSLSTIVSLSLQSPIFGLAWRQHKHIGILYPVFILSPANEISLKCSPRKLEHVRLFTRVRPRIYTLPFPLYILPSYFFANFQFFLKYWFCIFTARVTFAFNSCLAHPYLTTSSIAQAVLTSFD